MLGVVKAHKAATDELPDSRIWLIDGYNLLHASLGGQDRSDWWTAPPRERLLARIRQFTGSAHEPTYDPTREPTDESKVGSTGGSTPELWVIFDGRRPIEESASSSTERLRLVFAPSADEWIRIHIRDAARPDEIAVVTGDRPVADRARHRGAQVVSPRLFLRHCGPQQ